jgi:hypothetical protein
LAGPDFISVFHFGNHKQTNKQKAGCGCGCCVLCIDEQIQVRTARHPTW